MAKARKKRKQKIWQLQEAKARFSELINEVEQNGPCTITKNGEPVAVLISKKEFERLNVPKGTLIDFFKSAPFPELDIDIERNPDVGRETDL